MIFSFGRRKRTDVRSVPKPVEAESLNLSYQIAFLQGIGRRKEQQDSFALVNHDDVVAIKRHGLLAAVADGMGGMAGGKGASETVVRTLVQTFEQMNMETDIPTQLYDAIIEAGGNVYESLRENGGSTVVACICYDEKLYYASVGDSCLFLLRNGQLVRVNREQNSLNLEYMKSIRAGSVDPSFARASSRQTALSEYVGKRHIDEIDYLRRPLQLLDGDTILICSDGVSGFMSADSMLQSMLSGSPRDICSCLEENLRITNDPHQDNYTAIAIQCRY